MASLPFHRRGSCSERARSWHSSYRGWASHTGGPSMTCSTSYDFSLHGNQASSVIMGSDFQETWALLRPQELDRLLHLAFQCFAKGFLDSLAGRDNYELLLGTAVLSSLLLSSSWPFSSSSPSASLFYFVNANSYLVILQALC